MSVRSNTISFPTSPLAKNPPSAAYAVQAAASPEASAFAFNAGNGRMTRRLAPASAISILPPSNSERMADETALRSRFEVFICVRDFRYFGFDQQSVFVA